MLKTNTSDTADKVITLITGNVSKYNEIQKMTPYIKIVREDHDLTEIQDTVEEIVKYKCAHASYKVNGPVLVEDTSLEFNALKGMPGPYIKHFSKSIGSQGLYDMLAAHEDKSARAVCCLGYSEGPGKIIHLFKASVDGTIVAPRGTTSFDWDNIFVPFGQPVGKEKTFSEMGSEKNEISHRRKCVNMFSQFIVSQVIKSLDGN
jgi:inosine triphosphate pyrophosphatase